MSEERKLPPLAEMMSAASKVAQAEGISTFAIVAVLPGGVLTAGVSDDIAGDAAPYVALVIHGPEALRVHAERHIIAALIHKRAADNAAVEQSERATSGQVGHA